MLNYSVSFLADLLSHGAILSLANFCDAEWACGQRNQLLQVALALEGYRRDHKTYPETLNLLVPQYLPAIPDDAFASQPLRYQRTEHGYLAYSVSRNQKDDQGRDCPQCDDIVIRTPKPKTVKP